MVGGMCVGKLIVQAKFEPRSRLAPLNALPLAHGCWMVVTVVSRYLSALQSVGSELTPIGYLQPPMNGANITYNIKFDSHELQKEM